MNGKINTKQMISLFVALMLGIGIGTITGINIGANNIQPNEIEKTASVSVETNINSDISDEEIREFIRIQKEKGGLNLTLKRPSCTYVRPHTFKLIR